MATVNLLFEQKKNQRKKSEKDLNKIEARLAEGELQISSLKISCKNVRMSEGNLIIWSN